MIGASLLGELDPAADATLVSSAAAALGAQLQELPAKGDAEAPVQQFLMKVLESMRVSHTELLKPRLGDRQALVLWDTHKKGLAVGSRAFSAKPMCCCVIAIGQPQTWSPSLRPSPTWQQDISEAGSFPNCPAHHPGVSPNSTPGGHGGQGSLVQALWTSGTSRQA